MVSLKSTDTNHTEKQPVVDRNIKSNITPQRGDCYMRESEPHIVVRLSEYLSSLAKERGKISEMRAFALKGGVCEANH